MINLCPIYRQSLGNGIKGKFLPFINGNVDSSNHQEYYKIIENVEKVKDVLNRLNVKHQMSESFLERIVIKVEIYNIPSNFWCGGEIRYCVRVAKNEVSRFSGYTNNFYISNNDDNELIVAFPG